MRVHTKYKMKILEGANIFSLPVALYLQVSSEVSQVVQSDAQTFTIGVLPQIPGFPQLASDCDLQITVRKKKIANLLKRHGNPGLCTLCRKIVGYVGNFVLYIGFINQYPTTLTNV